MANLKMQEGEPLESGLVESDPLDRPVMEIHVLRVESTLTILALSGVMTVISLPEQEGRLEKLTVERNVPALVDFSGVERVDDYALRVILKLARSLHSRKAKLMIIDPSPRVRADLFRVNYHTLIPMAESVAEGLDLLELS